MGWGTGVRDLPGPREKALPDDFTGWLTGLIFLDGLRGHPVRLVVVWVGVTLVVIVVPSTT